jgi:ribosome-binding factor A
VLGDEEERRRSLAGLQSSHGVLQRKIADAMRLKRMPTLTFEYDDSVERGDRITRLLDE